MRLIRLLPLLLVSAIAHADDFDDCPQPKQSNRFKEYLVTFAENTQLPAALRKLAHEVIAINETEHRALVSFDDTQLAQLRASKLDVVLEERVPFVYFPSIAFELNGHPKLEPLLAVPGWELEAESTTAVPYAVVLRNPFNEATHDFIERLGLELASGTIDTSVRVKLTRKQAAAISKRADVRWVGLVEPLSKVPPELIERTCVLTKMKNLATVALYVKTHARQQLRFHIVVSSVTPELRKTLVALGLTPPASDFETIIEAQAPFEAIRRLARRPEVESFEPYAEPTAD